MLDDHNAAPAPTPPSGGRTPARPGFVTVFVGHTLYTFLHSLLFANVIWLMPLLVRLRFGSQDPNWKDWQTLAVTLAIPAMFLTSVFWSELLWRSSIKKYLLVFWLAATFPLGCLAFVQNYWQFLVCHVVSCAGYASWSPVHGQLLKHFYADASRGRIFGILNVVNYCSSIVAIYFVGTWMESRPEGFRLLLPAASLIHFASVLLLIRLAVRSGADLGPTPEPPRAWRTVFEPVLKMRAILKQDPTFLRYEQAFMTYGAAYMCCEALMPVLGTDKLGMRYEDYAHSTQMAAKIAMLVVTILMGWLLDRIGAIRTSAVSFLILMFYPLALILTRGPLTLGAANLIYGVGLSGVVLTWMLGPVMLAGNPKLVPQYVAIHATMVGVRGILFQGFGMILYKLTGGFLWPLLIAAAAFFWASAQMTLLHRKMGGTPHGPAAAAESRRQSP